MDKKSLETELGLAKELADIAAKEITGLEKKIKLENEGKVQLLEDLLFRALDKGKFKSRIILALSGVAVLQTFAIVLLLAR